jgi:hypothetical protein
MIGLSKEFIDSQTPQRTGKSSSVGTKNGIKELTIEVKRLTKIAEK